MKSRLRVGVSVELCDSRPRRRTTQAQGCAARFHGALPRCKLAWSNPREDRWMRFGYGFITCQRHPDDARSDAEFYREAIELSEEAEALGFDSVWTSEHHFQDDAYMPSVLRCPPRSRRALSASRSASGWRSRRSTIRSASPRMRRRWTSSRMADSFSASGSPGSTGSSRRSASYLIPRLPHARACFF